MNEVEIFQILCEIFTMKFIKKFQRKKMLYEFGIGIKLDDGDGEKM
jgi:hypothetical protein